MSVMCPWWAGFLIDNRLRRIFHDPEQILRPYIKPGMKVLDVGCGMGLFSMAMAKMVGETGQVIAVDVQQRMLNNLMKRAKRAGVADRIQPHLCSATDIGMHGPVDFALAFFSIHEMPDALRTFRQIHANLKPEALFYLAEPIGEVPEAAFQTTLAIAQTAGFAVSHRTRIRVGRAAILTPKE